VGIWDGKEGTKLKKMRIKHGETKEGVGHTGSVIDVCWSEDGKQVITVGADKMVCFFDIESRDCVREFTLRDGATQTAYPDGKAQVHHQLVSIARCGDKLLVGSLGGDINVLEAADGTFVETLYSHCGTVTTNSIVLSSDGTMFTGDYHGIMMAWSGATTDAPLKPTRIAGAADDRDSRLFHRGPIAGIAALAGGRVLSVGLDDVCRVHVPGQPPAVGDKLGGQPKAFCSLGAAAAAKLALCTTSKKKFLALGPQGNITSSSDLAFAPNQAIGVSPNGDEVCLGQAGSGQGIVRRFTLGADGSLGAELAPLAGSERFSEEPNSVAYSPDGTKIAVGWGKGHVDVYEAGASGKALVKGVWCKHRGGVNDVVWTPDGKFVVSGAIDEDIIFWPIDDPKNVKARGRREKCHFGGVNRLLMVGSGTLISCGADSCIRRWTF
jgi:WD40 repeat protein